MYARVIAFRFEQHYVGDSNDPAVLTVLDENALSGADPLGSRFPDLRRRRKLLQYGPQ